MLRQLRHSHLSSLTMSWLTAHAVRHSTDDKSSQSDIARYFKEPPTLSHFALPGVTILLGSCRSSSRFCFALDRAVAHSTALLPIPPRCCPFHRVGARFTTHSCSPSSSSWFVGFSFHFFALSLLSRFLSRCCSPPCKFPKFNTLHRSQHKNVAGE